MSIFKFELKEKVKDTITGFEGVVAARIEWMNGCIRYIVMSKKRTAEGKIIEDTIDEQQLISLEKPKIAKKRDTGGPMPSVKKFSESYRKR